MLVGLLLEQHLMLAPQQDLILPPELDLHTGHHLGPAWPLMDTPNDLKRVVRGISLGLLTPLALGIRQNIRLTVRQIRSNLKFDRNPAVIAEELVQMIGVNNLKKAIRFRKIGSDRRLSYRRSNS